MKITKALLNFVQADNYETMYRRIFKYKVCYDFPGIFVLELDNDKISKAKVKQFEREVKEFGLKVAVHNVLWLKANQDLKDLKNG